MPDSKPGSAWLKTPDSRYPSSSTSIWRRIPWLAIVALIFFAGIEWIGIQALSRVLVERTTVLQAAMILAANHAFQTLILIQIAQTTFASPAWAYRGGFFSSALLALCAGIGLSSRGHLPGFILLLTAGWLGALVGGITLTSLRLGLWEDNYPPSESTMHSVFQRHRREIGTPAPGSTGKRVFDIVLALAALVFTLPLNLIIVLLIWLEDPGPVIFVKNSVAKGGKTFHQFKFRTMVRNAEKNTGPVLANGEEDERVLKIGRLLRKTALDELPQLVNILTGQMSFVGPRPQRTILVDGYLDKIPGYAKRHQVSPGLAGLAQVAGSYYISPEEKLTWDLIYIERVSLSFDIKLILLAFMIVFWYRWQKDWDEHLPDRWLKIQSKAL